MGVVGYFDTAGAKKREFRCGEDETLEGRRSYVDGGSRKYHFDIAIRRFARVVCVPRCRIIAVSSLVEACEIVQSRHRACATVLKPTLRQG